MRNLSVRTLLPVVVHVVLSAIHYSHGFQLTSRRRSNCIVLRATDRSADDETNKSANEMESKEPPKKPKSRLAQLAEDWLEEEEDDELLQYWERFDDKQVVATTTNTTQSSSSPTIDSEADNDNNMLTTEQRLERYFDRRGINKQKERQYTQEIESAIQKAQKATAPQQALAALQEVRPWLQVNTRLGGTALVELAIALWQDYDEEQQQAGTDKSSANGDAPPNNNRDEALLLCQELLGNPHVTARVRQLIKNNGPPKRQPANLWSGFFNADSAGSWWN